ncbi:MAG: transcription-repair coupling factor, partial [Chloroflexi bacterium]|nr:transcription-repair coupling factor [Chloroflexota bacterium]
MLSLQPRPAMALRLPRAARPAFVASLIEQAANRPILFIAARHDHALTLLDELTAWSPTDERRPQGSPLLFAEPNPLFYEPAAWGLRTIRQRITTLAALCQTQFATRNSPFVVVSSARALMTRTVPRRDFLANSRPLKVGAAVRIEKMLETWVGAGYESNSIVVEAGQFSRRGGIIDVFPPAEPEPIRIELFGDEIESLRRFDPASQRSGEIIESFVVTPAREAMPRHWRVEVGGQKSDDGGAPSDLQPPTSDLEFSLPLLYPASASLLEYLPEEALVVIDDWAEVANAVEEFETQAVQLRDEQIEAGVIPPDFPLPYLPWAELQDELAERAPISLGPPDDEATRLVDFSSHFAPGPRFGGQLKPLIDHLAQLRLSREMTVVVTRQAARLAELWAESHDAVAPQEIIASPPMAGALVFVQGALSEGFVLRPEFQSAIGNQKSAIHLLTDTEIFGWSRPEARRLAQRRKAAGPEAEHTDFAIGDYVVHIEYGIGRFGGLVKRAVERIEREYLFVEYDGGDELYVPIHQADRLTRYVGLDDHPPTLSRLGTADWSRVKERTQEAVIEVARALLELYATRETAPGHAFTPDGPWQRELEDAFPYVETEDQLKAIAEVKTDMEKPRPMDRLICGDVGYGKTEVALRAAFKAVMDGHQVALLVPTTILAQQHLTTFAQRLAPYPVTVEMLSRFRSRVEQQAIVERLAEGRIDIIIGTHRLLQKDVKFKNLGLLIIDEEQRFGVTHKEYLKQMRTEVDVLTLTATPIPRTLYMSLTGVRDISTINTPPEERLPVVTQTGPYSERLVRQAILRELDRDGQIFFVHNRVQTIGAARQKLVKLVPEARIGVAHGQMEEYELAEAMSRFTTGDIDMLLCTSIIESGLDIPNANTLIVDRADTFGLAQLYQLRGRVGRGAARAYAYFFHERRGRMTVEAHERLDTIAEQTELGAGYGIAMRDLEIRGAGDLLGMRQHGHIAAVGFHLYTRLLRKAIHQLKTSNLQIPISTEPREGGAAPEFGVWDLGFVSIDLPIPTIIPTDYIPDRALRLQLYRRLAELNSEQAIAEMRAELADRFGPRPEPVENLLFQLRVKVLAARAAVEAVSSEDGMVVLKSSRWDNETDRATLAELSATPDEY